MLKRLRLKFVCINMVIVTGMLCVIFATVLRSTASNLENQNIQAMRQIAAEPIRVGLSAAAADQIRLPYLALQISPQGELLAAAGSYFDLTDQDFLFHLIRTASVEADSCGVLEEYSLRYYRTTNPMGQYIIFSDISQEQQTLRSLTVTCLVIGAGSFLVFLVISLLLARWAVKPVEKAWKEQQQFIADASHELKMPLTVIMTNAQLLSENQSDPQRRQQFTDAIVSMSGQMRGLVEGLLELARVDNGTVKAAFADLDLSQTVSDAVLPFDAVFFENGLELICRIEPDIRVRGSGSHLRQVMEILLDNAQKYACPGTQVVLQLRRWSRGQCLLTVASQGEPISPEDLKNIFRRFYRVDKARTMNHSYGLGLSIAQSIVSDHRGRIWAESRNGINTFSVQLPTI